MARIFMDGFEYGTTAYFWTGAVGGYYGSIGVVTSLTHLSGAYCVRSLRDRYHGTLKTTGGYYYTQFASTYNKLYVKLNFRYDNTTSNEYPIVTLDNAAAVVAASSMRISCNPATGNIYLYVNGSLVATVTSAVIASAWHLLEVLYDDAANNIVVKCNNLEIIDYSGSIESNIQYLTLFSSTGASYSQPYQWRIDDVAVNDDTGSINNSWIGNSAMRLLTPTADGSNTNFTPLSGPDNYAMVDEVPSDGDTSYNYSSTPDDIDTFDISSVPTVAGGQTINAVQHMMRVRAETDATAVAPILISGVTTDQGTSKTAYVAGYEEYAEIHDTDPNTSAAWDEADVNALEIGYKMTSS